MSQSPECRVPESWLGTPVTPETARGQYLCEVCEDVMTNDVLPAAESPHGLELAICALCRLHLSRHS